MQESREREYPIPFHNDVFFKYMLIGEGAGSTMLRSRIIEEIYGLKVQKTQVLNPGLPSEAFFGKRAVLNVVLEDKTGHLYDSEVQVSGYTKEKQLRFQQYGYRLVDRQLKQGNDCTKLKPFYQIIFMSYKSKDTGRMIQCYTVKDENSREKPDGILYRAIVFLPMIRQRVKGAGGIENLAEFETFCYVLAYNPDDAILNMRRRMMNVIMKKYNEMREGGSLYNWVESMEFAQRVIQASLGEQTAEAGKSELERGFKQGLQKDLDEGKGTLLWSFIVYKYGIEDEWVGSLSDQQMDDTIIQILDCDMYKTLKGGLRSRETK